MEQNKLNNQANFLSKLDVENLTNIEDLQRVEQMVSALAGGNLDNQLMAVQIQAKLNENKVYKELVKDTTHKERMRERQGAFFHDGAKEKEKEDRKEKDKKEGNDVLGSNRVSYAIFQQQTMLNIVAIETAIAQGNYEEALKQSNEYLKNFTKLDFYSLDEQQKQEIEKNIEQKYIPNQEKIYHGAKNFEQKEQAVQNAADAKMILEVVKNSEELKNTDVNLNNLFQIDSQDKFAINVEEYIKIPYETRKTIMDKFESIANSPNASEFDRVTAIRVVTCHKMMSDVRAVFDPEHIKNRYDYNDRLLASTKEYFAEIDELNQLKTKTDLTAEDKIKIQNLQESIGVKTYYMSKEENPIYSDLKEQFKKFNDFWKKDEKGRDADSIGDNILTNPSVELTFEKLGEKEFRRSMVDVLKIDEDQVDLFIKKYKEFKEQPEELQQAQRKINEEQDKNSVELKQVSSDTLKAMGSYDAKSMLESKKSAAQTVQAAELVEDNKTYSNLKNKTHSNDFDIDALANNAPSKPTNSNKTMKEIVEEKYAEVDHKMAVNKGLIKSTEDNEMEIKAEIVAENNNAAVVTSNAGV